MSVLSLAAAVVVLGLLLILSCFYMAVRKFGSVHRVRLILAAIWSLWAIRKAARAQFRTMREKEMSKDAYIPLSHGHREMGDPSAGRTENQAENS